MCFKIAHKATKICCTFVITFLAKNFQKFPNLVTLYLTFINIGFGVSFFEPRSRKNTKK